MTTFRATLTGLSDVIGNLQASENFIEQGVIVAVLRAGINCQAGAKIDCAVDTGRLRASITVVNEQDGSKVTSTVGTNVEYGPYVEFGTYKMAARPFMYPNFVKAGSQLEDDLNGLGVK